MRSKAKSIDPEMWFQLLLGGFLFLYILLRAGRLAFTYDESWTCLQVSAGSFLDIILFKAPTTNNHLINSLLVKILSAAFHPSPLVLRLPSVLSFIFYFIFICKTVNRFCPKGLRFLCTVLLAVNPYVIDFFSLERGYGLSLGLMSAAFYYFFKWAADMNKARFLLGFQVAAVLSVLSNLVWLHIYLALVATAFILVITKGKSNPVNLKKTVYLFLPPLLLLSYYLPVILYLRRYDQANFGGSAGLWKDSVESLISDTLYDLGNKSHYIPFIGAFVILIILTSVLFLFPIKAWTGSAKFYLWLSLLMLSGACFLVLMQNQLFHVPFPVDRVALWMLMPFGFLLIFSALAVYEVKRWMAYTILLPALILPVASFSLSFNFSHSHEWQYGQDEKKMFDDLVDYQKKHPLYHKETLNVFFLYYSSAMYYVKTVYFNHLENVIPTNLWPGYDYYYLDQESYNRIKKMPHQVISYYPETGSYLIRNLDKKPDYLAEDTIPPGKDSLLKKGDFKCTRVFSIDSLLKQEPARFDNLRVEAWGEVNFSDEPKNGSLVISLLDEKDSTIGYKPMYMTGEYFGPRSWEPVYHSAVFDHLRPGYKIAVYYWNQGETSFSVKDLKVRIYSAAEN